MERKPPDRILVTYRGDDQQEAKLSALSRHLNLSKNRVVKMAIDQLYERCVARST